MTFKGLGKCIIISLLKEGGEFLMCVWTSPQGSSSAFDISNSAPLRRNVKLFFLYFQKASIQVGRLGKSRKLLSWKRDCLKSGDGGMAKMVFFESRHHARLGKLANSSSYKSKVQKGNE